MDKSCDIQSEFLTNLSRDFDTKRYPFMVDRLEQKERYDRELNVVKRARFNQTIEQYQTNEVPEPKFGVEPHTVKELPALPVREHQQDNMLHQHQDNMFEDGEVVSFGQRAQQQDQQQLQLRQHNIPHNPVYPEQFCIAQVVGCPSENGISYSENGILNSENCSENTPEISENGLFTPRAFFLTLGWSPGF